MRVSTLCYSIGLALLGVTVSAGMAVAGDQPGAATETTQPAAVGQTGMRAALDPETGELRALTGAERARLGGVIREQLERSGASGPDSPVLRRADGSRTKVLDARYAHWMTAHTTAHGPVGQCDAASSFEAGGKPVDSTTAVAGPEVR